MLKRVAALLWVLALMGGWVVGTGSLSAAGAPKAYVGLFKDDAVAVIDTAQNKVLSTITVPKGPHGLVVTPDGRKVYVSSDGASTVSVIDTAADRVVASIDVGANPHGLAISAGHRHGDGSRHWRGAYRPAPQRHAEPGRAHSVGGLPAAGRHGARPAEPGHVEGSGAGTAGQDATRARAEPGRPTGLLYARRRQRDSGARHGHQRDRHADSRGDLAALHALHTRRPVGAGRDPGPRRAGHPGYHEQHAGRHRRGGQGPALEHVQLRRPHGLRDQRRL